MLNIWQQVSVYLTELVLTCSSSASLFYTLPYTSLLTFSSNWAIEQFLNSEVQHQAPKKKKRQSACFMKQPKA